MKKRARPFNFGPDPNIEPPELPHGDPTNFLDEKLIPLLTNELSERAFLEKGKEILKDLWRRTHIYRPDDDRERRGRKSSRLPALRAISMGLALREHGRLGQPTQADLKRILSARIPQLDEDTCDKYAKLYRLTILQVSYESLTKQDWAWLVKHDRDFVHRAFFTIKTIRDCAKQRGFPASDNERGAISTYLKICTALQGIGTSFRAPSYNEVITFTRPTSNK